jgi:cAMP phosphodiesterase
MIDKSIENLKPYFIGLRIVKNYYILEMTIKHTWVIPDDEKTQFEKSNEGSTIFYSEEGFDVLLEFIYNKVIKPNLELEEKERLLTIKVEELKRVFESNTLDKLQTLRFSTDGDVLKLNIIKNESTENIPSEN